MDSTNRKRFERIAKQAIKLRGYGEQREMMAEECSELILAIQKLKRAENTVDKTGFQNRRNNFIEEQIDVMIVIMQFYLTADIKTKKIYDDYMMAKMERLDYRNKEYKKLKKK